MKIVLFMVFAIAVVFGLIVTQWGMPSGVAYCDKIIKFDYATQTTGKTRYVRIPDFSTVAMCGDACSVEECPNCPPEEWTCEQSNL